MTAAQQRITARDELLQRCLAAFSIPAVSSIHLLGSLARDAGDDLSDIDLWVTIDDAAMAAIARERSTLYASVAPILIAHETARNRPVGGVYTLVIHDMPAGLLHVDYYLAPRSSSVLLPEARLLYGDDALPRGDWRLDRDALPDTSTAERIDFLMCMGFIGVKMARRGDARFMRFLADEYRAIVDSFQLNMASSISGDDTTLLLELFQQLRHVTTTSQCQAIDAIEARHLPLATRPV